MSTLIHQRCLVHSGREAAAQCPECRRYFCRECVSEHDGRMICAHCIRLLQPSAAARNSSRFTWAALSVAGFLFSWLFFYYLGIELARIPATFHGGTP